MKKYYQYFGLALIMVFSFYYTEQIASIVLNKNKLMVQINEEAKNYNISPVNAIIEGEYITPGLNGLQVNAKESFYVMKEIDAFNKYFLVYDQVKPDVSLNDNKDKIVKKGNRSLNKVSFVLESENTISNYFKNNNIEASMLVDLDTYKAKSYFEVINNENEGFKSLENTLNLNKENKHICILNDYNKDKCLKNKNYLVEPTSTLTSSNLIEVKKGIESGSIILIKENASLEDVLLLLKEVKYKDLKIVPLSKIISEENSK